MDQLEEILKDDDKLYKLLLESTISNTASLFGYLHRQGIRVSMADFKDKVIPELEKILKK